MLEGKDPCAKDRVYLIVEAYIDHATELQNDGSMIDVYYTYSDI